MAVVQRDHVLRSVELGIAQANHGERAPLAAMCESDGLVYYSPRESLGGRPLKEFTAIGRIADDALFQVAGTEEGAPRSSGRDGDFRPWRRRVDYQGDAEPTSIRPLLGALDFSRGTPNWGYQLRRGVIELTKHDFELIRAQMRPSDPAARIR